MFETRSQAWKEVGLLRQISPRVVKRARLEALVLLPLFVGVVIALRQPREPDRHGLGPHGQPGHRSNRRWNARAASATVLVLVILGWAIARDVGRGARARRCSGAWTRRPPAPSAS